MSVRLGGTCSQSPGLHINTSPFSKQMLTVVMSTEDWRKHRDACTYLVSCVLLRGDVGEVSTKLDSFGKCVLMSFNALMGSEKAWTVRSASCGQLAPNAAKAGSLQGPLRLRDRKLGSAAASIVQTVRVTTAKQAGQPAVRGASGMLLAVLEEVVAVEVMDVAWLLLLLLVCWC